MDTQPHHRQLTPSTGAAEHGGTEHGAVATEYAILGSLIAAVLVSVVAIFGTHVVRLFQTVLSVWP